MKNKVMVLCAVVGLVSGDVHAVSIQELMAQGRIPKVRGIFTKRLNLSGLGITDLTGLENIPGIDKVQILMLGNNNIATIPAGSLAIAKSIRALGLQNNGLTTIEPGAFEGLNKLWVLVLNANSINDFPQGGLSGLPKIKLLSLGNNPITANRISAVRKQVPTAHLFFLPITRANLGKAGVAIAGLATLALAVVGAAYVTKEISQSQSAEEMQEDPYQYSPEGPLIFDIANLKKKNDLLEEAITKAQKECNGEMSPRSKIAVESPSLDVQLLVESLSKKSILEEQKRLLAEKLHESLKNLDSTHKEKIKSSPEGEFARLTAEHKLEVYNLKKDTDDKEQALRKKFKEHSEIHRARDLLVEATALIDQENYCKEMRIRLSTPAPKGFEFEGF